MESGTGDIPAPQRALEEMARVVRPGGGLIDRLLEEAPAGAECFRVSGEPGRRRLVFRTMLLRWRRP